MAPSRAERIAVPEWVRGFYTAVDANEGAAALAQMAPDISLQFGARAVVVGRDHATATLRSVHTNFARVSHSFRNVWQAGDNVICEFVATYLLHDGSHLPLPTLTVLHRSGEQIDEMRVYIDEGPLTNRAVAEPSSRDLSSGW